MTDVATADRRTGLDRREPVRTIADVRRETTGHPFSIAEIAALLGISGEFIRRDIKAGEIKRATDTTPGWYRIGRGKDRDYRIEYEAARTYILALIKKG